MNWDRLLLPFSYFDRDILKSKVEFKNPLSKNFYHSPKASKAYVLLGPWHSSTYLFHPLKNEILDSKFSCLQYNFIPDILSPDVEGTIKYFEAISQNIRNDMEEICDRHGIKDFVVLGCSLSSVTASMVSSNNGLVKEVVFVGPANSLAKAMWNGLRTANIRRVMEKNGVTLPYLERRWENLAPQKYSKGFKGKRVKFVLSQSDIIVPYPLGKEFADGVKQYASEVIVKENKNLGHYLTIIKFCFMPDGFLLK